MLVSMIELISLAASNSLAVFCFCNVIIAILVVASSKTSSHSDETTNPGDDFPTIVSDDRLKRSPAMEVNGLIAMREEKEKESCVSIDMIDSQDEEDEDDEEEDELRKRVEEFIEKTNRGWEAEKMNRYNATLRQ